MNADLICGQTLANFTRGIAADDGIGRDIVRNHRSRPDYRAAPNCNSCENYCAEADPDIVLDKNLILRMSGQVGIFGYGTRHPDRHSDLLDIVVAPPNNPDIICYEDIASNSATALHRTIFANVYVPTQLEPVGCGKEGSQAKVEIGTADDVTPHEQSALQ